jgi:hypothetical protein
MAIGDKPNQNLFGTNYNAEEEERKKAELAAQGAMMGANIPASAFGQAPAVNPFSMEAAGQVNPMMQPQNLESFAQPQVTFRDYDVPEPPRASALSVFTPGGDVKPGIDVNAITPSPEMTSTSAVNTALNQEVAVGTVNTPSIGDFFFGAPTPEQAQKILDTQPTSPSQRENLQAIVGGEERPSSVSKGFDYLFGSPDVSGDPNILQKPSVILDPFTGKTIEKPTPFAYDIDPSAGMDMNQQAVSNAQIEGATQGQETAVPTNVVSRQEYIDSIRNGTGAVPAVAMFKNGKPLEGQELRNAIADQMEDNMRYGRSPSGGSVGGLGSTAPTNGLTTVGGASLSEFLSGQAMPEQGFTEAESPLGGRGVTLTQDQMNQLSAERESRIGADQAISDRDRRAARGDGISMADQVDMAKANARGATPREVARGNQVANALGVDLKTGQPLQATGGLTFDQIMKLEEFDFKRGQEAYKRSQDDLIAQGKKTEAFEQDSALLRQVSGDAGRIGRLTNEAIGLTTEPGTTALSGSLLKLLPGSNANQLEAVLEVLQSKVALDRLMEVKKTGATLGQVSEKELAMLQNSYDALKQGLKPERLREALTNYANQLKKVEDQTQRAFIDKHGQGKFNKIMGGGSTGQGEPRYANDQDVGDSADTYYNPSK